MIRMLYRILCITVSLFVVWPSCSEETKNLLNSGLSFYPRAIRLSHPIDSRNNNGVVVSVTGSNNRADIYFRQTDRGEFQKISEISDPDFVFQFCCGTIFELPADIGRIRAGSLIWAGSIGKANAPSPKGIKIFLSEDSGHTWRPLPASCVATGARCPFTLESGNPGIWEPEFTLASDGALVMYYSDETGQPARNQSIQHVRTYDLTTWRDISPVVASAVPADRPGMAVLRTLKNGSRFMTWENCGPASCAVFYKTSRDGWDWGRPDEIDPKWAIHLPDGRYFEHAPNNAVTSDGWIVVIGQILYDKDGKSALGSGETLFINKSGDPGREWEGVKAPVSIKDVRNDFCPNYSSSLLVSVDGHSIEEFSSDYKNGVCVTFYGTGEKY